MRDIGCIRVLGLLLYLRTEGALEIKVPFEPWGSRIKVDTLISQLEKEEKEEERNGAC
jgi:hypothetical protein